MSEPLTEFIELAKSRNHNAARLLEAHAWTILDVAPGRLHLDCHLPQGVLNLGGTLFGGFTPTYVDLVAIWTCMTTMPGDLQWLHTVNMRVDYLEPIGPPGFQIKSHLVNVRRRDYLVETRFILPEADGERLLAFAITTLRRAVDKPFPGNAAPDDDAGGV